MAFFGGVLGLRLVDANQPGATFECGNGTYLEIYPSAFAGTAQSTVAGFQVSDLETAMRELRSSGIVFEDYDSPKTVEGIAQLGPNRGAWFKDPDGNIFALVESHSAETGLERARPRRQRESCHVIRARRAALSEAGDVIRLSCARPYGYSGIGAGCRNDAGR